MMFDLEYNGSSGRDHNVLVMGCPEIQAPEKRREVTEIAGRDGALIETDNTYGAVEITVRMNFLSQRDTWMACFRDVKSWLLGEGGGQLLFSDDQGHFYKVLYASIRESSRIVKRIGRVTADFVCDPYSYLLEGQQRYDAEKVEYNAYERACPVFYITGEGMCELQVNGKTMRANVGQNLVVDTERMISYREDGQLQNTAVSGDYEDLYLLPGENTITITEGFRLEVRPNWREL